MLALARRAASSLAAGPSPRCLATPLLTPCRSVWNDAPPVALSSPGGEPVPVPFYDRRVEEVREEKKKLRWGPACAEEGRDGKGTVASLAAHAPRPGPELVVGYPGDVTGVAEAVPSLARARTHTPIG